ncbi:MAG: hypothetical protein PUD38_05835 [Firmicutes bacterium]|nr:hypothetical protein [Bacillota bacterium]
MEENESFSYTYSAEQRREVEAIRKKYLPKEEDKMEQLRKLHAIPTQKAQTAAISVGIIGSLIMGTGMSLAMTDIGDALGNLALAAGILAGLMGMALIALAYPVYNRVIKKQRARIAPEILKLTDELMK